MAFLVCRIGPSLKMHCFLILVHRQKIKEGTYKICIQSARQKPQALTENKGKGEQTRVHGNYWHILP